MDAQELMLKAGAVCSLSFVFLSFCHILLAPAASNGPPPLSLSESPTVTPVYYGHGDFTDFHKKYGCPREWQWNLKSLSLAAGECDDQFAAYGCEVQVYRFNISIWGASNFASVLTTSSSFFPSSRRVHSLEIFETCELAPSSHLARHFSAGGAGGPKNGVYYVFPYNMYEYLLRRSEEVTNVFLETLRTSITNAAKSYPNMDIWLADDLVEKSWKLDGLFDSVAETISLKRLLLEGYSPTAPPSFMRRLMPNIPPSRPKHTVISLPYLTPLHTLSSSDFDALFYDEARVEGSIFIAAGAPRPEMAEWHGYMKVRLIIGLALEKEHDREELEKKKRTDDLVAFRMQQQTIVLDDSSTNNNNNNVEHGEGTDTDGDDEFEQLSPPPLPPLTAYKIFHALPSVARSSVVTFYDFKLRHTYCLEPPGDTPSRRSIYESVLLGCIPVFFHKHTIPSLAFAQRQLQQYQQQQQQQGTDQSGIHFVIPWEKFSITIDVLDEGRGISSAAHGIIGADSSAASNVAFAEIAGDGTMIASSSSSSYLPDGKLDIHALRKMLADIAKDTSRITAMRQEMRKWAPYLQFHVNGTGAFEAAFAA